MNEKQNMDMESKTVDYYSLSPESPSNTQINHVLLIELFSHISVIMNSYQSHSDINSINNFNFTYHV